jgi:site-specific DNA-methyltransferase (adenine-specific)/adenine-specific DNA-methyltransferase
MARTDKKAYDLSDAEQRDLVTLIQQGKSLPEKYRFILFEDKREIELIWNGKTRDVCTTVLPFQTLEHIDEPREEMGSKKEAQFDWLDPRGRQIKGWTNKLIWGDNKLILSSLKAGPLRQQIEDAGGLKLIYIDPPFDVGADFSMDIEIGGETFHKEPTLLEQIAYRDTWGHGADSYIAMIYERLCLMRDLMHGEGSIYVHCDWRMVGALRLVMDEVFGNIENIISWKRSAIAAGVKTQWRNSQDFILFYSKSGQHAFNPQFGEYSESSKKHYSRSDEKGNYRVVPLMASGRSSGETGIPWRGVDPNRRGKNGMHWLKRIDVLEALDKEGLVVWNSEGIPELKYYLADAKGVYVSDFWDDIDVINSMAIEYEGYNTQKPETLIERIVKASSNEGDLVADFFVGSGTTAAVAEKLGRKWIAADLGKFGIHTTRKRLIGVQREMRSTGKPFRAFEVLNLGRYERQAYLNVGGRLTGKERERALVQKEREFRGLILRAYKAQPLESLSFFHGKNAGRLVVVGPINLPVGRLFVEEVIMECRKIGASRADILAFEFEMGLFPAALEEARQKGIDLAPKYIPAEVFDKRAVGKGQVVFHDISFVEATPRYNQRNKLAVQIELTDFSVYYSQGAAEAAIAAMKDGKNGVICDRGQLYKVTKTKDGVVEKERLTKRWTDWVDYWAVDFDYESRKEIVKIPKSLGVMEPPVTYGASSGAVAAGPNEFEEQWTGSYIFENEWQSFRTRQNRELELKTTPHVYDRPGRYTVAVKVIDIFGNDTMTLVPVNVG